MFTHAPFLESFGALDCQIELKTSWTAIWSKILNEVTAMSLSNILETASQLADLEVRIVNEFKLGKPKPDNTTAAAEVPVKTSADELAQAPGSDGRGRDEGVCLSLAEIGSYIIEDSSVPSETLEVSKDMLTLSQEWARNYNATLSAGLVKVLQSSLQSRLYEMLFIGPCCDAGLKDIFIDVTASSDRTPNAKTISESMKLHLLGNVATVKVGSGYPLVNLLGIQFYVNGNFHDSLDSECAIPAWLVPAARDQESAVLKVTSPLIRLIVSSACIREL
jgi:hypothetical protein